MKFKVGDRLRWKDESSCYGEVVGIDKDRYILEKYEVNRIPFSVHRSTVENALELDYPECVVESPLFKIMKED
jgi:hypothetical protein